MKPSVFLLAPLLIAMGSAEISHLDRWFLVEDPPDASLDATIDATGAGSRITLTAANAAIPAGTDIGDKSINGSTAEDSTAGYVFDPGQDFTVALDYDVAFSDAALDLGIGFGIGEDDDGTNSAGIALLRTEVEVAPGFAVKAIGIGATARIDDATQPRRVIGAASNSLSNDGALFITYTAATGDVVMGHSETPGAVVAEASESYAGLQKSWDNRDLLVSFFLRSEGSQGGTVAATFSNLRVIEGAPKEIAPQVVSVSREGQALRFAFKGGVGWSYLIRGGSNLDGFPDELTDSPGTLLLTSPSEPGVFTGEVDVSGKGASYFLRFGSSFEP